MLLPEVKCVLILARVCQNGKSSKSYWLRLCVAVCVCARITTFHGRCFLRPSRKASTIPPILRSSVFPAPSLCRCGCFSMQPTAHISPGRSLSVVHPFGVCCAGGVALWQGWMDAFCLDARGLSPSFVCVVERVLTCSVCLAPGSLSDGALCVRTSVRERGEGGSVCLWGEFCAVRNTHVCVTVFPSLVLATRQAGLVYDVSRVCDLHCCQCPLSFVRRAM